MSDDSPFVSPLLGAAAGGLYLTGEDNFRLTTWGSLAGAVVALEGRFVSDEGCTVALSETQIPLATRAARSSIYPAREGILTNIQLRVSTGTARRGQIFALLEIVRGREGGVQPLGTLLSEYVTSAGRIAWPGSILASPLDGRGLIRNFAGNGAAAGAELLDTVPTGARWRLLGYTGRLQTDATVAARSPRLSLTGPVGGFAQLLNSGTTPASTTTDYYMTGAGTPGTAVAGIAHWYGMPPYDLTAGATIATVTALLQAADQWLSNTITVEEWLEP